MFSAARFTIGFKIGLNSLCFFVNQWDYSSYILITKVIYIYDYMYHYIIIPFITVKFFPAGDIHERIFGSRLLKTFHAIRRSSWRATPIATRRTGLDQQMVVPQFGIAKLVQITPMSRTGLWQI